MGPVGVIQSALARNVFVPLSAWRSDEKHLTHLKELRRSQFYRPSELERFQDASLYRLLHHAASSVPYYRGLFGQYSLNLDEIEPRAAISRLPLLTKETIQMHGQSLVSQAVAPQDLVPNKTGGSTGKPIRFFHDRNRVDHMRAGELRHNEWAGWRVGDRYAAVWGAPRDFVAPVTFRSRLSNLLVNPRIVLDSSSLTDEAMLSFARKLTTYKPKGILAYAGSLAEFAAFVRSSGIAGIHPDSIITSAEMLYDSDRQLIEETFGCRVYNRYGCREVSVVASECSEGSLHISADCLYVEFLRDDGTPAPEGEPANVVITDMFNYGMPLIRYKIEDLAAWRGGACKCGRGLPIMSGLAGRSTDFLVTAEGAKVSGVVVSTYLITNAPGVRQVQLVQDDPEEIRVRLVRGSDYSEQTISFLQRELPKFFGHRTRMKYEFTDQIPKEPSGKYRFSVCNLRHS